MSINRQGQYLSSTEDDYITSPIDSQKQREIEIMVLCLDNVNKEKEGKELSLIIRWNKWADSKGPLCNNNKLEQISSARLLGY